MNKVLVFYISIIVSLFTLFTERLIGIGWDYHPDSYTYATTSSDVYSNLLESGILSFLNNLYYVIVHLFGQSIIMVTAFNILIYSFTNVLLYRCLINAYTFNKVFYILLFVFANPYRIHLSTTMLKDTLIIFLLALVFTNKIRFISFALLIFTRVVSILYIIPLIRLKYYYVIILTFLILLFFDFAPLVDFLLKSAENEMTFREFDRMPTFQNFGVVGSFIRGFVWAPLSFTGLFLFISPTIMFIPISFGIYLTIYSFYKMEGRLVWDLRYFSVLVIFGILVTGFTSYLRYIYPLLCLYPIIVLNGKISNTVKH